MNKQCNTMMSKFFGLFVAMFLCISSMIVANGEQALVPASMVQDIAREIVREEIKEQNTECGLHCIVDRAAKAVSSLTLPQLLGVGAGGAALVSGLVLWKKYGATPADLKNTMNDVSNHTKEELDEARKIIIEGIGANTTAAGIIAERLGSLGTRIGEVEQSLQDNREEEQRGFTSATSSFQAMDSRLVGGFAAFRRNTSTLFTGARNFYATLFRSQRTAMQDLGTLTEDNNAALKERVSTNAHNFSQSLQTFGEQQQNDHQTRIKRLDELASSLDPEQSSTNGRRLLMTFDPSRYKSFFEKN